MYSVTVYACIGGAGGREVHVTILEQTKWDGKGPPPEAVEKVAPPYHQCCRLTDLQADLTDLQN